MWTRAEVENLTEKPFFLAVAAMNAPSLTNPSGNSEMADGLKRTNSSLLWFERFRWFKTVEQSLWMLHMKLVSREVGPDLELVIGIAETAPTSGSDSARAMS